MQRPSGLDQHRRERGDGLAVKVTAGGCGIDVNVGNGFLAKFVGELLAPFRGAGEADFFAIPTTDHDGAARAHTLFRELPQGAGHFHHGCGAAAGIDAAEGPGIAMVAEHDPFVGQLCAANAAFDDVIGLRGIIHLNFQMDAHAIAAEVIVDGQSTLPCWRRDRTIHIFEQRFGIVPGERQSHYFWQRRCLI